jgi:acetyltransferase-like isoleucine patch superfamily enzyme
MIMRLLHAAREQLWGLIEWFVIFFPNPLGFRLRYWFWKFRLKALGRNVRIGVGVKIAGPQYISIGSNCWIDDYVLITAGPLGNDGRTVSRKVNPDYQHSEGEISIGNYVHLAPFVVLQGHAGIKIGDCLTIASGSKIYSVIHHYKNIDPETQPDESVLYKFVGLVPSEEQSLICSPVVIQDNAAVGLNSVILPGSVIGKNSWLGAQSLLNCVLPENVIAYGIPAKIIKRK